MALAGSRKITRTEGFLSSSMAALTTTLMQRVVE